MVRADEGVRCTALTKHPAKYTDKLLPIMAEKVRNCKRIIDFNAGTCKIVRLRDYGYAGQIVCLELEPEWAEYGRDEDCLTLVANAEHMPLLDNYCDGAVTSIVYGNRMSDCHNAKDGSSRNTYTHVLGRKLTPGNAGMLQWGPRWRLSYRNQFAELRRVLCDGATLVLNISDHIRNGKRQYVTLWVRLALKHMGFALKEHIKVPTPRNKFGANGNLRVEYESILVFTLHKED